MQRFRVWRIQRVRTIAFDPLFLKGLHALWEGAGCASMCERVRDGGVRVIGALGEKVVLWGARSRNLRAGHMLLS